MNPRHFPLVILAASLLVASAALAKVTVTTEQLNPADSRWKFKTIPGASKSDVGQNAKVTIAGNQWEAAGGGGEALVNGSLPTDPLELTEEAWLSNKNGDDGVVTLDLGKVQPVAAVNTYSWHEWTVDQGSRAPQVYALSGSVDGETWSPLADVDTRPNQTGVKWNGQHGVSITGTTGKLGDFRYLRLAVQRTRSPQQADVQVTGTLFAEIDVHTRATLAKAGDATAGPDFSNLKEVIVVCKTHFDIGYTHRVKDVVQYYRTSMIDKALGIMEQNQNLPSEQQFAWTAPGWVMSKVMEDWPGQTPERRQKLDAAFKSGKFLTHALPFTLESDACEVEEMARGFAFSSALSRHYGLPLSRSGKMTDVPSHGGALATVLANGGVHFMHIGCNWPSGNVKTPGIFWWEGPDGSRVLTIYSPLYGTCTALSPWLGPNDVGIGHNLIPPPGWPHKTWPAIIVTPDNSGPPSAAAIKALFDEAARKLPGVKVRMGTMDDFVDAILAEKPDLPVVRGEMPDTWIHGVMCDPGGIKLSRGTHPLIAAAEALHTQLGLWGLPQPTIDKEIALAYEKILLYGEHTWGGAAAVNQYGDAFKKRDPQTVADLEASWEDKTDYIRTAATITQGLSASNLQALALVVKAPAGSIIVYNPLPWKRSGTVTVNGQTIIAENIPPCGYKTLPGTPGKEGRSDGSTLENAFFKLSFDPRRGTISSLIDKRTGREWIDAAAETGLGQYLNERFTFEQTLNYTMAYQQGRARNWPHPGMHKPGMISEKQVPYRAATPANGTVKITGDDVVQTAVLEMPADAANQLPATTLKVSLSREQPCIDLEITIKDKAKDNWPEADWLCLPFKIADPQFRVSRPLGVMNPATDILPGANRDLYSVGHGVTIADAKGDGIAICPLDHPLISLDRPGCWKFSTDFVPKKPVVYLNLYNNQWNTNFRYWYPGTWSSRVRLWTFNRKTAPAAIIATPALEARNPLQAVASAGQGGTLPAEQAGLSVSRTGVPITAFGNNPDGPGTLLRVWEQAGVSGSLTITLPGKFQTATPVNLRGEKTGKTITLKRQKFSFTLPAYAPASFVLEEGTKH